MDVIVDEIRYYFALITLLSTPQALIYWFIVHPFIDLWRRMGKGMTYTVLIVMYVITGYLLWHVRGPLLAVEYGTNSWLLLPALVFYVTAVWIQVKIRKLLPFKVMAGVPELDRSGKGGKLLNTGLYTKIRHPRYLAVTMGMIAFALFTNYLAMYAFIPLLVIGLVTIAWLEERELVERFGEEYVQYRRRVPMIIPQSISSAGRPQERQQRG
jgi:protein-S-isoprenylcysteine O-methyltransferase Ste14